MRFGTLVLSLAGAALMSSAGIATASSDAHSDFRNSTDPSAEFLRLRCSLDSSEHKYSWWTATVYAQVPGEKLKPLLGFEGYNVCRVVKLADGSYQLLTREVSYYKDLKTGKIIEQWDNPYTGKTDDVMHVHNDPVNTPMPPPGKASYPLPWKVMGNDVMVLLDIPLDYPNELSPKEFPEESSGERYIASEHFGFFAKLADMNNPKLKSVPYVNSWFRTGPWLPWMKMGQRPGGLICSGEGKKLDSFADLPAAVQAYTRKHFPKFVDAPTEFVSPNETTWSVYRDMKRAQASGTPASNPSNTKP